MSSYDMLSTKDLFKYVFELQGNYNSNYNALYSRIKKLEDFQAEFVKKRDFQVLKKLDFDLDPKELSEHFNKSYENFRQLKKKFQATKDLNSMWIVYCKAYHLDKLYKHL